jgi:hypothetical protein
LTLDRRRTRHVRRCGASTSNEREHKPDRAQQRSPHLHGNTRMHAADQLKVRFDTATSGG